MTDLEKKKILEDARKEFKYHDECSFFDDTNFHDGVKWGIVYTLLIFANYNIITGKEIRQEVIKNENLAP